jgi:hypothetical protein
VERRAVIMGRTVGVLVGAAALVASAAASQTLELEGRFWPATLAAQVNVTGGRTDIPADLTMINLKDDLGLKDKNLADWRLTLTTGPHSRLRVGYLTMSYSADQTLHRTVVFNGTTYTVGTRVISDLGLDYWRLGWIWYFAGASSDTVQFGSLLEAKRISTDASVAAPELASPIHEKKSFAATLPSVGMVLDIKPSHAVDVYLEASGVSAGTYGRGVDAEAGVKLLPVPSVSMSAGYRYFDLEAKDNPDFAKIKNTGPYVGLALRF